MHIARLNSSTGTNRTRRKKIPLKSKSYARQCSHKSGSRAACSISAFPHSDHAADMPDRSELGHFRTREPQRTAPLFGDLVGAAQQRDWAASPNALAVLRLRISSILIDC
jgi:hypothetical protein